jgi:hypothetical protein
MRPTAISACLLSVVASMSVVMSPGVARASYVSTHIGYGFPHSGVAYVQNNSNADVDYASVWAVAGNISGVDDALVSARNTGTTPVIHWYYWGWTVGNVASNGTACVDNYSNPDLDDAKCDSRTRQAWDTGAAALRDLILSQWGTAPAIVTLELEFHQGATAGGTTAENMDGYLANQAAIFHSGNTSIKTVLGFGEWASPTTYNIYDRAAAAADYEGTQILFSCINQTKTEYLNGPQRSLDNSTALQAKYGKPVFIYDFGLSSYSGPLTGDPDYNNPSHQVQYDCKTSDNYEVNQETAYRQLVSQTFRDSFKAQGVIGVVFRDLYDEPNRPNWWTDYHRLAEKYWGIRDQRTGDRAKLSYDDVIAGIQAENGGSNPPPPPPPPPPGDEWKQEAEVFASRPVGGQCTNAGSSGGACWNVWSNGTISTTMTAATAGVKKVNVVAHGDPAGGVWPHMVVKVDGTTVSDVTVGTDVWSAYGAALYLAAGSHSLSVTYDNDGSVNGNDRNLLVDYATLNPAQQSWTQECESFPTATAGGRTTSAGASGGAYWNLWSNGYLQTSMSVPYTSAHELDIVARGDVAATVWPIMNVYVDGVLKATTTVNTTTWTTYRYKLVLSGGTRTLKIEFTNDANINGEDRNLKLDVAKLYS